MPITNKTEKMLIKDKRDNYLMTAVSNLQLNLKKYKFHNFFYYILPRILQLFEFLKILSILVYFLRIFGSNFNATHLLKKVFTKEWLESFKILGSLLAVCRFLLILLIAWSFTSLYSPGSSCLCAPFPFFQKFLSTSDSLTPLSILKNETSVRSLGIWNSDVHVSLDRIDISLENSIFPIFLGGNFK